MRVLIIGLDGATWNVFDDSLLDTCMPTLRRLKDGGCSGVLRSTEPPLTAAAWTTCITGCQPSTHGIIGWHEYDPQEDRLRISTAASRSVPDMWQELSKQDYTIASINVPWTYPCPKVNGIVVAGYGCPGLESQFTYPESFKAELLAHMPDYQIVSKWDKSRQYDLQKLDANLKGVERSFEQRLETARLVSEKVDWNIMMVQFHDTDLIEHYIWPYLDKDTRDQHVPQRNRVFETYKKLDQTLAELLDVAATEELIVVVLSDHGLRRAVAKVRPNVMLCQWGYLKRKGFLERTLQHRRRKSRLLQGKKADQKSGVRQPKDHDFNWAASKAMMTTTAINGHICINVKGRQPDGIVEPDSEYDKILQELKQLFSEAVNPHTQERLFAKVGTPAEVYGVSGAGAAKFGDLVIVPEPGVELVVSDTRRGEYVETARDDSLLGTHSYEGIYLVSGKGIRSAGDEHTHIVNVAPTIYAALQAKLPLYLDGKVLTACFEREVPVAYQASRIDVSTASTDKQGLSAKEEAEITKYLSALGYME